jgi:hypothetical protein
MSPRRGAPLGNNNALKHGFYSRDFNKSDLKDLEAVDLKCLTEEINLIRLHLRRLSEHALNAPTLADYLDILRLIGFYTSVLDRLVKTQVFLAKQAPGLADILEEALKEAQADWPNL